MTKKDAMPKNSVVQAETEPSGTDEEPSEPIEPSETNGSKEKEVEAPKPKQYNLGDYL